MKIKVLKGPTGKVLATFETGKKSGATLEPQVRRGHSVHNLEVPRGYHRKLQTIYKKSKRR